MYYRLSESVALRKWKYVDRALNIKEMEVAVGVPKEGFPFLLFCDGVHDLESNPIIQRGHDLTTSAMMGSPLC